MLSYDMDAVAVAPILVLRRLAPSLAPSGGWLEDRLAKAMIFVVAQGTAAGIALILFTQTPGLVISAVGGAMFTLVNASSRPTLLRLPCSADDLYKSDRRRRTARSGVTREPEALTVRVVVVGTPMPEVSRG